MKAPSSPIGGFKPPFLVFCFLLFSVAGRCAAETVWIDTDIAIGSPLREVDDAFALLLAFRSSNLKIAGISTSYGNAPLRGTTASARALLAKVAQPPILYPGAESANDLGRETEASRGLAAALSGKRELTYIALGPLTNLATFQALHPDLVHGIRRVIFLGGTSPETPLQFGSRYPIRIHDANVVKDAKAVRRVLSRPLPVTLIPVETASQITVGASDLDAMRQDPAGSFIQQKSRFWLWFWTKLVGTEGGPIFDTGAILAAADPSQISFDQRFAAVDSAGNLIVSKNRQPDMHPVSYGFRLRKGAASFVRAKLRGP